jgi:hypothetical protein
VGEVALHPEGSYKKKILKIIIDEKEIEVKIRIYLPLILLLYTENI